MDYVGGVTQMRFKHTYVVTIKRWTSSGIDTHGNPTGVFVDEPALVYGIAPTSTSEPEPGSTETVDEYMLIVPSAFSVGPRDRVVIDGLEYGIEGRPQDWSLGPFSFQPKLATVTVRRVGGRP